MTIYGDVLYRGRPYDLAKLDDKVDRWYVMAYDFHKAGGLPGPTFPLKQGDLYPYSLETLVEEWPVPMRKTHIVIGMFGYTWRVDELGRPLKVASAVTARQGMNKRSRCQGSSTCSIKRDSTSSELLIREKAEADYWDETWVSDSDSAIEKISFLRSRGISGISFWALGYF
ncbi:MAG: putative sporulation-specific glycosylase YdhD [Microgenomates bacterium OLB22]|nr:MAG: putative sporulation-specific glycosylase YdhD [Microgenomates bacterium OLB22]